MKGVSFKSERALHLPNIAATLRAIREQPLQQSDCPAHDKDRAHQILCLCGLVGWLVSSIAEWTIDIVVAASQAVFSEQVVSKLIRLEWLRVRFETTYETMYNLFQS